MPRWWTKINKRVFNPAALRNGKWAVLTHVGRSSGRIHRTPLDAIPVDGGFAFFVVYGSQSDWVQNVLTAGRAKLAVDGDRYELTAPRIVGPEEAREMLPAGTSMPPTFLNVSECLRMDLRE